METWSFKDQWNIIKLKNNLGNIQVSNKKVL